MIDVKTEEVFLLADAHKHDRLFPRSYQTLWQWAHKGCRALDGSKIKLETIFIGGRLKTSAEALYRFINKLNEDPGLARAAGTAANES